MSQDADKPKDADAEEPVAHTSTLSEPKAEPGKKAKAPKKPKKQRPEPTTPMGKLWHNWVKPIGSVVLVVVVFRSMLLDWNDVPTGSMEPEIHVGDRIAVNRLAYGLQFPLTGPQIGIPFTPIQFDNPLDGIPQIEWGDGPQRSDIVTFWNPVSNVRMVKRIVAIPGDTIEIRDSKMIINGTAATYKDLDAVSEGLEVKTKYNEQNARTGVIKEITKPLLYRSEVLFDQTKITQHIEERWQNYAMLQHPNGTVKQLYSDTVTQQVPVQLGGSGLIISEKQDISVDQYLKQNPSLKVLARVDHGKITIAGKSASYNEFVAFLLKRYETGVEADLLNNIGLGVKGHELLVDGEPVFSEQFDEALKARALGLSESDLKALNFSFVEDFKLIRSALSTNFGPYTVPEDGYLMIGDNRNNSSDGRFFGPVQRSEITGKAFAVAFSFEDNKMLALPPDPAWDRFFKDLD
ncbi:MAG: signal peptidase I [Phycisphaeraceae bacterium]